MLPACPSPSKPPSFVISPCWPLADRRPPQETGGDLGRALTHPVPVFSVCPVGEGGQPQPLAGLAVDYLDKHKVCGK